MIISQNNTIICETPTTLLPFLRGYITSFLVVVFPLSFLRSGFHFYCKILPLTTPHRKRCASKKTLLKRKCVEFETNLKKWKKVKFPKLSAVSIANIYFAKLRVFFSQHYFQYHQRSYNTKVCIYRFRGL